MSANGLFIKRFYYFLITWIEPTTIQHCRVINELSISDFRLFYCKFLSGEIHFVVLASLPLPMLGSDWGNVISLICF